MPFNVDAATNRLMASNGTISYDKDSNQTNDGYSGGSRSYGAENRMTAAQERAYAYDAEQITLLGSIRTAERLPKNRLITISR